MKLEKSLAARHSDPLYHIPLWIFFVTFFAFSPVLRNGFVWDDYENLVQNPRFCGLGWSQLKWMFTTFHMGLYQPLSWLSYGLDFVLWGLNPKGYHLSNITIHAANAVLVYICSFKLYEEALNKTSGETSRSAYLAAVFSALFFSLHPLRVESVAWATERRDVLSSFFALASIILYMNASRDSSRRTHTLSITSYGLSLLSKPAAVGLPFWLLLIDFYPLRRWPYANQSGITLRKILTEKAPYLILAVAVSALAPIAMHSGGSLLTFQVIDIPQRLLMVLFSSYFYILKTIIPLGLLPLYLRPAHIELSGQILLATILVPLTAGVAVWSARQAPAFTVAWFCYSIMLLPTSGLMPNGPQIVADRYSYLSCVPWAVLIGGAVVLYIESRDSQASRAPIAITIGIGLVAILFLTERQLPIWHDEISLWEYMVVKQPENYFAHYNLARALQSAGNIPAAKIHYKLAAELNPAKKDIYINLGILLATNGEQDSALAAFQAAQRLAPSDPSILNDIGNVLSAQRKIAEAVGYYEAAARIHPGDAVIARNTAQAWLTIGTDAARSGQYLAASHAFRSALTFEPNSVPAMYNLATSLALLGRDEEAASWYVRVCDIDSSNADARINLAQIYHRLGREAAATQQIQMAQKIGRRISGH